MHKQPFKNYELALFQCLRFSKSYRNVQMHRYGRCSTVGGQNSAVYNMSVLCLDRKMTAVNGKAVALVSIFFIRPVIYILFNLWNHRLATSFGSNGY